MPRTACRRRSSPIPKIQDLELWSYASAEAQVAALADDIAYDAHDIDDGLRADLFALDDIAVVPLIGDIVTDVDARYAEPQSPNATRTNACAVSSPA